MIEKDETQPKLLTRIGRLDPGTFNADVLEKVIRDIQAGSVFAAVCMGISVISTIAFIFYAAEEIGTGGLAQLLTTGVIFALVGVILATAVSRSTLPLKSMIQASLITADALPKSSKQAPLSKTDLENLKGLQERMRLHGQQGKND
jgi:hypothetical protein